ncbi:hypothetical protein [Streptomyces sp. NPDC055287]
MTQIKVVDIKASEPVKESDHDFIAPANTVLVGRSHEGDEEGKTIYYYGTVQQNGQNCKVGKVVRSDEIEESGGTAYTATQGRVIVGRSHSGDENGTTTYHVAELLDLWGNPMALIAAEWTAPVKEFDSNVQAPENQVLIGRQHTGDEMGDTRYLFAKVM